MNIYKVTLNVKCQREETAIRGTVDLDVLAENLTDAMSLARDIVAGEIIAIKKHASGVNVSQFF